MTSSTEFAGSFPIRAVPHSWNALPGGSGTSSIFVSFTRQARRSLAALASDRARDIIPPRYRRSRYVTLVYPRHLAFEGQELLDFPDVEAFPQTSRQQNRIASRLPETGTLNAITALRIRHGRLSRIKAGQIETPTSLWASSDRLEGSQILPRPHEDDPSSSSPMRPSSHPAHVGLAGNARASASESIPELKHKEILTGRMTAVRIRSDDLSKRPRGPSGAVYTNFPHNSALSALQPSGAAPLPPRHPMAVHSDLGSVEHPSSVQLSYREAWPQLEWAKKCSPVRYRAKKEGGRTYLRGQAVRSTKAYHGSNSYVAMAKKCSIHHRDENRRGPGDNTGGRDLEQQRAHQYSRTNPDERTIRRGDIWAIAIVHEGIWCPLPSIALRLDRLTPSAEDSDRFSCLGDKGGRQKI